MSLHKLDMIGTSSRRQARGYVVALAAVTIAAVLIRLLQSMGYAGLSPLFAAVVISAWYGGIGPAVFGVVCTTLAAYYLLPKSNVAQLYHDDFLRATVFTLTAMVAVAIHLASRRTEEAARKGKQTAEAANEAKTRLLAMVSHDLRSPLNPILMAVALAEQNPLVAEQAREHLDLIRNCVALEVRLIEDLLDVARLATGKFKVSMGRVDVHEVLEGAILACQPEIKERRLTLGTNRTARSAIVKGDAARLQQLFWNLVSNSIKFTPKGGSIAVRTYDTAASQIAIEVRDSGVGIDPRKLPFVFKAFEQGDADRIAGTSGLGLGLAICQGIVDAHGGSITASSAGVGLGAVLTVRLPTLHGQTPNADHTSSDHETSVGR